MSGWLAFLGMTVGGWIGWWLGSFLGFAPAVFPGIIGSGVGLYLARRFMIDSGA